MYLLLAFFGGIMQLSQLVAIEELQVPRATEIGITEIAIGSTNSIKIRAVKNAVDNVNIEVIPYSAASSVRSQPLSDEETLRGATNRAKDCLEKTQSRLAIGLEAGIVFLDEQVYLCHWGALVDKNQNTYITNGPIILLPQEFRQPLLDGKNLEEIMHQFCGIEHLGSKEGAIGIFTKSYLNREQVLTQIAKSLIGQYCYYHLSAK